MQEVMTRIELGGVLGKTFGKVHHRLISRVNEASVALAKTIPGFEQFMISSQHRGLTYSVFKGKRILVLMTGLPGHRRCHSHCPGDYREQKGRIAPDNTWCCSGCRRGGA